MAEPGPGQGFSDEFSDDQVTVLVTFHICI